MVRVNFADVPEQEKLPPGTYHFAITDLELKETADDAKHPNNDYWNAELTVQSGELQGRKEFVAIMLPPYDLFTLVGILRATVGQHEWTEEDVEAGEADVEMDDLLNLEFIGKVSPQKKSPEFNQVKFKPITEDDAEMLP